MRIVRKLPNSPDALFSALELRFLRECAEHGEAYEELSIGSGYEDAGLLLSVCITAFERNHVFSWKVKGPATEVVTTYSFRSDGTGCEVELIRDYVGGAPVRGALSEALFLGNMSNELAALAQEATSPIQQQATLSEDEFLGGIPLAGLGRTSPSKNLSVASGPRRLLSHFSSRLSEGLGRD